MTLIKQTKSETQRWEDKGDGNQELVTDICYLPTYEYTVNGEVYHYTSRHGSDTVQKPGMQRTGYYEPSNPKNITEYQRKTGTWGCPLFYPGSGITDFRSCCASEFVMVMILHLSVFCACLFKRKKPGAKCRAFCIIHCFCERLQIHLRL